MPTSIDHGNAARAAREARLGTGTAAKRVGHRLLQKPYIRTRLEELKADAVIRADQRAQDDERIAALTREVEIERLEHVELAELVKLEVEARKLKFLERMLAMRGGMDRNGSRGGTQSRFARVCRQWRGEPAQREPGRCCCGVPATSARGASCDRCRERNRHYRPAMVECSED